jgi:hypothetical protein
MGLCLTENASFGNSLLTPCLKDKACKTSQIKE